MTANADVLGRVRTALMDADGKTVATAVSRTVTIAAGETLTFSMRRPCGEADALVAGEAESVPRGYGGGDRRQGGRSG